MADLLEELADRWPADSVHTRRAGGAGLGLALGTAIAQAHGGQLTLVRRAEQGAVFQLRLAG